MPDDLDPVAVHEAAHAVVAHFYGGVVTVIQLASGEFLGKFDADMRSTTRITMLLTSLAGRAAQIKVDPSAREFGLGHRYWSDDMRHADHEVKMVFYDRHGSLPEPGTLPHLHECREIRDGAENAIDLLLSDPPIWSAICAVAKALATSRTLDGDRFRSVVSKHLDNAAESLKALAS